MYKARIVIAEDESIVARDIQQTLSRLGYHVPAIAVSGAQALQRVAALRPDLVLMDIRLRGDMDGIAVAEQILRNFDIPVIYLTAHSDAATLQRARRTEPYGYIVKPFDEHDLHVAIEIALYRHSVDGKLKRMERWLAATLTSIGDAVIATDTDGIITFLNPVAEALTGWQQGDAVGQPVADVFVVVEEADHAPIQSLAAQVLHNGLIVELDPGMLLIARDGRAVPISDSAAPIRDDSGAITGTVLVFRDITERKRLESQFLQAQKMESIGRLAGGVAHDFNNLLTAILGYAELVLEALPLEAGVRNDLREIQKAAGRATSLTRQLLAFARKQIIDPQVLRLNDLILDLDKLLRRLLGENIVLRTLSAPDTGMVRVDSGQIEQVIVNLAVNARDAMPSGGTLTIETLNIALDQIYAQQHIGVPSGDYVLLAVSDTGIGMDEAVKAHIFEPFFTTKDPDRGSGLGLATCYGIVKQHGGHIAVYSEVGRGTTIKVYLPRVEAPIEVRAGSSLASDMPRGAETILLVEDDPAVRELIARLLHQLGYTVLEAGDGVEALELARSHTASGIRLLISDMVMPRMGGATLAKELRSLIPSIAALFISGYTDNAAISQDQLFAGEAFLHKPFSPGALARQVRELLDR